MALSTYFCLNGEFIRDTEPRFFPDNRAFRYGEALVENIHAFATGLQFTELHMRRLKTSMEFLETDVPAFLNESNIRQLAVHLLNRNKTFGGAVIRLTVYRDENIRTGILQSGISFLLESRSLEKGHYELNERGLIAGISEKYVKNPGLFSGIHRVNSFLYTLAGNECRQRKLDTLILLNDQGRMVETSDSNLFVVKARTVFTPGINQGCIPGIMRHVILRLAKENGLHINDQSSLTQAALKDADEVFITNAVEGIQWIGAWEQIRYFNKTARMLCARLNESAFK